MIQTDNTRTREKPAKCKLLAALLLLMTTATADQGKCDIDIPLILAARQLGAV